jgi:hypothetical protein
MGRGVVGAPATHAQAVDGGAPDASRALLHARVRWVGVACACLAFLELLLLVVAASRGLSPWSRVPLGLFTTGISLGAFGANNDTALVLAARVADAGGALPPSLHEELAHEARARPSHVSGLHASPRASWVLPVLALALVAWLGWRLATAFAGGPA